MKRTWFAAALLLSVATTRSGGAEGGGKLLLQKPALGRTQLVFCYAGDLWVVGRDGGDARRLTAGRAVETRPAMSPDGTVVAFTGAYDGNVDVYVVPVAGGVPLRLTHHPADDEVAGWSPDGTQVLFRSERDSYSGVPRLFTVKVQGGYPQPLPLPMAQQASYSPDGTRLAYVPTVQWQRAWKRYRGGQTTPIWIANLADSSIEKVPRENSNDFNPIWIDEKVYFLSDREGPVTLFAYDTVAKTVARVIPNDGLDMKWASAEGGAIAYEQFGSLHLLDRATGQSRALEVRVAGDLPEVRPRFVDVEPDSIRGYGLSPSGARAVFEVRGDVLTVPGEKGDVRNLTRSPGVAERDPAWSPDGASIAYFSDGSGEYGLEVRDQGGMGEPKRIALGAPPSFFYSPRWSPDSKKIAYTDKRLNIWYVDVAKGTPVKVDTDRYETPFRTLEPEWSPDGRFLAYVKNLRNHLHAVFVYSLEQGKAHQVTDGMSDALHPRFDKDGKHLYFTASTDVGLAAGWLDMSGMSRKVTRSAYVVVLRKDLPSPLAPQSDEEDGNDGKDDDGEKDDDDRGKRKKEKKTGKKDGDEKSEKDGEGRTKTDAADSRPDAGSGKASGRGHASVRVSIDFDGIGQRILALPIPARNYTGLATAKEGQLFLLEGPVVPPDFEPDGPKAVLHRFDFESRKTQKYAEDVRAFAVSMDGEKMLYRQGETWAVASTEPPKPAGDDVDGTSLKLEGLEVYVEPRAEWRQMYRETWRIQRDFLYDPGHHGLDLAAAAKKYEPYLEGLGERSELNDLFEEMLGELSLGHVFVGGGQEPDIKKVKGGLLGADYSIEGGRYRFARVYNGENWNPDLRAPLTQPGVNVSVGEYLLAVNGQDLRPPDTPDRLLENTADKSVVIKVAPTADGKGARDVTVVPVESEEGLRRLAWIEDNRRTVDRLTGGRVAYVYLPDTAGGGFSNFNRYYFAQVGKEAAIIDERFNGGGNLADYVIDYLRRPLMSLITTREGEDYAEPVASIYGPKVMIIDEFAGSGGDALPWYFRKAQIGPLVGKRTWGGLVGIYDYPELMDGGYVTAPRIAIYGLEGDWEVENRGVAPDIEVELDPKLVRQGHDPQLEKAVEVVLELLQKNPLPKHKKPTYPNYHQTGQP